VTDLVQRLRASATQARAIDRAALLQEAADEIEQLLIERSNWRTCFENERALHDEILRQAREMAGLRGRQEPSDIVTRLRQTRANMLGTDDEQHYWDCHNAAAEIERLRSYAKSDEKRRDSDTSGASLTDAEREAIREAAGAYIDNDDDEECAKIAATLHGLLKRLG
jgi:hypothetical protein